jgi:hypothetical protein
MTNDTATPSHSNRSTDTDLATGSVIQQKALDKVFGRRNVRKMGYEPTSTTADASQRPRLNRSRWAAIGAAVAVSLGAGGFGLANATISEGEMPVYIAIDPCRLTDTRPQFLVGPRATPYGPNETVTWVGTGAQGNCNVPAGVSALALNVTALDATAPTYLQFAPGNTVTPGGASSLNPVPGEPPTPNAVTISIDDEGEFSIYNLAGTVHVIIDVVGYFDDHMHTGADIVDGSLTGADVEDGSIAGADITDGSVTGDDVLNNSLSHIETSNEAGIAYNSESDPVVLTTADVFVVRTRINVPSDGYVVALAELQWENGTAGLDRARCQITKGADTTIDANEPYLRLTDGGDPNSGMFYSDTHQRVLEVAAADDTGTILTGFGQYINLVCDETNGAVDIEYSTLTLQFFPTDYTSGGLIFIPFPLAVNDGMDEI